MGTTWLRGMFVRGGTSKGLFFDAADLPTDRSEWDALFLSALGSPDAFGRQLDGMGGGISSLSKVMVVSGSQRPGIDLDYTFGQVSVGEARVDYSANCGNLSAAIVPFALASGLHASEDGERTFHLYNTNTGKDVDVRLEVRGGLAADEGAQEIPGVSGTSAPIALVYPNPAGSRTNGLLPTGRARDALTVDGVGIDVSLVDATLALVIVRAADVGLRGDETPDALDASVDVMARLAAIRREGAVRMGIAETPEDAPQAAPKIAVIASSDDGDLSVRAVSMGRAHKAVPGTAAMCLAAAALVPGTLVAETAGTPAARGTLRMDTPSGVVTAGATVDDVGHMTETTLLRTARILMRGEVATART